MNRLRARLERRAQGESGAPPTVQGVVVVTVLRPGESRDERMYPCGLMTVGNQASKIIHRNVEGTADLSCASEQHTIAGHVEFANCH